MSRASIATSVSRVDALRALVGVGRVGSEYCGVHE